MKQVPVFQSCVLNLDTCFLREPRTKTGVAICQYVTNWHVRLMNSLYITINYL